MKVYRIIQGRMEEGKKIDKKNRTQKREWGTGTEKSIPFLSQNINSDKKGKKKEMKEKRITGEKSGAHK